MELFNGLTKDLKRVFQKLRDREGDNFKGYWSVAEHITGKIAFKDNKSEYAYFDYIRFYRVLPEILDWISSNIEQERVSNFDIRQVLEDIEIDLVTPTKQDVFKLWLSDYFNTKLISLKRKENKSVGDIYYLEMLEDLKKNYKEKNRKNIRLVKKELGIKQEE